MIQIGLTGNVASGKSTVARVWAAEGVPTVSADELSRAAVAPGGPAEAEIRDVFGEDAFDVDGVFDRSRMRDLVFRDPVARGRLESVLHPHIRSLRDQWLEERRREGASMVVSEVPLLFETGLEDEFDIVVVVHASEPERERRLINGRKLDTENARLILRSQGDPDSKLTRADYVIQNDGTLGELEAAALDVLAAVRRVAGPSDG